MVAFVGQISATSSCRAVSGGRPTLVLHRLQDGNVLFLSFTPPVDQAMNGFFHRCYREQLVADLVLSHAPSKPEAQARDNTSSMADS
ncbi:MAG: hypothetical protein ACKOHK_07185, partial [Planctomycetia bacterium]